MRSDVELAEMAAKKFAGRSGGRLDWTELVGVAWSGIAKRAASRARRNLPEMTESQRYMAAYSELVDEARKGSGGFGGTRYRDTPLVGRWSDMGDDAEEWLSELAARPTTVVVPAIPRWGQVWTQDEIAALRTAVRRGTTAAEVAAGLGRTVPGVWGQMRVHARPGRGRKPNHAQRSELLAHIAAGLSVRQAAARLGLSAEAGLYKARLMVRDGLLVRTGRGPTRGQYVPA